MSLAPEVVMLILVGIVAVVVMVLAARESSTRLKIMQKQAERQKKANDALMDSLFILTQKITKSEEEE